MDEDLARQYDPLHDQRQLMPSHEFDGTDYFTSTMPPAPAPLVLAYFDSWASPQSLVAQLPAVAEGMVTAGGRSLVPVSLAYDGVERGAALEPFGPAAISELAEVVATPGFHHFGLSVETPDNEDFWFLDAWLQPGDAAVSLSLSPSPDLWPTAEIDQVADRVLDLVLSWIKPLALSTGGITYDRSGAARSAWDMWYGVDYRTTAPLTKDRVRGYFWANILTSGQLARLPSLLSQAESAGLLVSGVDDAVLLRAPGGITSLSGDELAAVKKVLGPALLPTPFHGYDGYPLRIVPDPGTAFRHVGADEPRPRLIPGQGPMPGSLP